MPNKNIPTKTKIRRACLEQRDGLDPAARIEMSLSACEHGLASLPLEPGQIVSGFWPIGSEIDPRPLMSALQERGARLCLPVVMDKTTIEFRELTKTTVLTDAGFGTMGPGPEAPILDPQIMLVPLAAFDTNGGRIGYGAGFYDRAIEKLTNNNTPPHLAGLAFDCQRVKKVPMEPHDQRLHMIITESGAIVVAPGRERTNK